MEKPEIPKRKEEKQEKTKKKTKTSAEPRKKGGKPKCVLTERWEKKLAVFDGGKL